MMERMYHRDLGEMGSEFVVKMRPLKNCALFVLLLTFTLGVAFSFGLHLADKSKLAALCVILMFSLFGKLCSKVHSEKVLILSSVGVQVETQYFLGYSVTYFIDITCIKDIVINEAFTMHSVLYYLVVLLKDRGSEEIEQLFPLFAHSWPPLRDLRHVYESVQLKLIQPALR